MHRSALLLLRLFGARALPTRSVHWEPPMAPEVWEDVCRQLVELVGSFDAIAVGERTQGERSGFASLLLNEGHPRAFVKFRRGEATPLRQERTVMDAVERAGPRTFMIPATLGVGESGGWTYLAMEPLPSPMHRVPRRPPLDEIVAEIGSALQERPRGSSPPHWMPMHGDFTPWNLRELPGGALVLFDWEDTAWAPPGADAALYHASAAAIGLGELTATANAEVADFWIGRIRGRAGGNRRDGGLEQSLLRNLDRMKFGAAALPRPVTR